MYKSLNFLIVLFILFFFFNTYKYYSSNKNLKVKDFNRDNINKIINEKITNLPVLSNDTSDVIEFNNTISGETNIKKPRSFWNLLKPK